MFAILHLRSSWENKNSCNWAGILRLTDFSNPLSATASTGGHTPLDLLFYLLHHLLLPLHSPNHKMSSSSIQQFLPRSCSLAALVFLVVMVVLAVCVTTTKADGGDVMSGGEGGEMTAMADAIKYLQGLDKVCVWSFWPFLLKHSSTGDVYRHRLHVYPNSKWLVWSFIVFFETLPFCSQMNLSRAVHCFNIETVLAYVQYQGR